MTVREVLAPAGVLAETAANGVGELDHNVGEGLQAVSSWTFESFDMLPISDYCGDNDDIDDLLDLDIEEAEEWLLADAQENFPAAANIEELTSLLKDAEDLMRATSSELSLFASTGDVAGQQGFAVPLSQKTTTVCAPSSASVDSLTLRNRSEATVTMPPDDSKLTLKPINKRKAVEELTKNGKQSLSDALRPFHCSFSGCNYKAAKPRHLREHERTHTGERPYQCPWPGCTYAAAGQGHISRHMRTHTGVKPYVCKEPGCGYATGQSGHLRTHMRTHTGERPFKCPEVGCTYAAGRRGHLQRHMKTHSASACADAKLR